MNRAGCGSQTRGPDRAYVRRSGSWSQCVRKSERRLPMNRVGRDSVEPLIFAPNAERLQIIALNSNQKLTGGRPVPLA